MSNFETNNNESQIENAWVKLSPEQEKSFLDFLKRKEQEASKKFTENEINNLKNEFLESQENDFTKSSLELLSWTKLEENFWEKENFEKFTKTLDSWIYNYFFGKTWVLKEINISENEKKSFVASSWVFLLDYIYEEIEKTWNMTEIKSEIIKVLWKDWENWNLLELWKSLNNLTSKSWENISKIVSNIKNLLKWDIPKVLWNIYSPEKIALIWEVLRESNLKNNQIFSNPKETFNFFENIFKNNFDKNALKNFVESKNSDKAVFWDKNALKNIWDKIWNLITPEIWNSLWKIGNLVDYFKDTKENIKNNLVENKELLNVLSMFSSVPVIWKFIKMFFDFLWIDMEEINNKYKEKTEIIKTKISGKDWFFENIWFDENFAKSSDWKYDWDFINKIIILSKNKNENELEKDLWIFLKKWWDFDNFINDENIKNIPWVSEKLNLKNNSWNLIYENFKFLIDLQKEFFDENQKAKISTKDFLDKKISEKNKIENEVFWWNSSEENEQENQKTEDQEEKETNQTQNTDWIFNVVTDKKPEINDENKIEDNSGNSWLEKSVASAITAATVSQVKENNSQKNENSQNSQNSQNIDKNQTTKINENFLINKNEWLEIKNNKINFVFSVNWKKFEATVFESWHLTIIWNWKKYIFDGNKDLHNFLIWFNWKLDKKAKWSDFWESWVKWSIELNWKTIKDVLINWLNEEIWFMWIKEKVNKPWLKQIITNNFFNSWNVKKENISINIWNKNYNFNFNKELT